MKLGLGLYRHMLTVENLRFARQAGATHIVAHLVDYFSAGPLEWYPEWDVDLGAPTTAPTTDVASLLSGGVYRRDFQKGSVLVNPSSARPINSALVKWPNKV